MTNLVYAALAVAAGVAATVQAATNAGLAQATGLGPAVIINTIVVLLVSIGLWAATGAPCAIAKTAEPASGAAAVPLISVRRETIEDPFLCPVAGATGSEAGDFTRFRMWTTVRCR